MRAFRVPSGDVELAVTEQGRADAPTVVLVHGYPDTREVWDGVAASLERDHRVVRYDVRGAGESTAPRGPGGYALGHLARDLESVLDATSVGPVHLVGHDWGAIQSWEAVTEPRLAKRIRSFTAISGPCLDHVGHALRGDASLSKLAPQALRSWYIYAFHVPGLAELAWRGGLSRAWPSLLARVEGVERVGDSRGPHAIANDGARGVGLYRDNVRARLRHPRDRRTDVPVQIIAPRGDHYVAASTFAGIERWAPNAFVREVVGGHWIVRTHPDRVARWVSEMVERTETRASSLPRAPARRARKKVVVITGGGSGIGRATAFAFAERGARIVVADVDRAGAERTALLCRHIGAEASVAVVDVGDEAKMALFARDVASEHGAPDIVVNNAGIGIAGRFLDTSPKDWERVLRVNLWGVLHGCRLFGEQMTLRGEGGHIVNVASMAAFAPSLVLPAYATTKAAVLMLSECLRAELAPHGIGVSAICPGIIDTPITSSTTFSGADPSEQERARRASARLYRRRGLGPEVVAKAVLRAVDRDLAVVPVSMEAHALQALARVSPALTRRFARLDLTPR